MLESVLLLNHEFYSPFGKERKGGGDGVDPSRDPDHCR